MGCGRESNLGDRKRHGLPERADSHVYQGKVMYQLIYRYRTAVSLGAIVCAVILATAVSASMAMAQSDADAEWPCIQAYVPEVAAAVIWPEPIEEQQVGGWRQDKELKSFVNRFGALEVFTDDARLELGRFAESVSDDLRIDTYNRLADGIVTRFNERRLDYFKGIRKFTRQQIAIAKKIESHLNELAELESVTDTDAIQKRKDLEETTQWQQRIFDRREKAIGLLCETPVELETILGDILRELAQFLP